MKSTAPDSPAHLDLVRTTAHAWHLEAVNATLVSQGENLVYKVETTLGESVALRLHRPGYHTLPELRSEQQWTSALNESGIHVPIGRPLPHGDYYLSVTLPCGEQRYAGVVDWLGGMPLGRLLETEPDAERLADHYRRLGTLAARIHNQSAHWKLPEHFARHHLDAEGLMGEQPFWGPFWTLPELTPAQRALIQRSRHYLYELLSSLDRSPDNYSMIHADLHAWNLLIEDDQVTVIDFDDAGFGWHIYETAVSLFSIAGRPDADRIRDAYVEGYRAERSMTDATLDLLPLFCLLRAIALLGWIHHRRELDLRKQLGRLITMVTEQAETLLP